jgi:glycosyltransferase involved in cell wall biosynthesis
LDKFKPVKKDFHGDIGILCHLTPRKRVYELILAFYELVQLQDGFHLHIGGGTRPRFLDYDEALHQLVKQLGLQEKVTFYGNVTNPESWYQKVDIFVSNSYSEGLQVSPIEAIASGCYCLSHWWDGADELLPKENLYHTNSQFIQHILGYSALPDNEKKHRKELARCFVNENFDVEKVKIQIRQVIEEVAESSVH